MQTMSVQALLGQMGVNCGQPEVPGCCGFGAPVLPAALRVEAILVLLDAGDMVAQSGNERAGFALLV